MCNIQCHWSLSSHLLAAWACLAASCCWCSSSISILFCISDLLTSGLSRFSCLMNTTPVSLEAEASLLIPLVSVLSYVGDRRRALPPHMSVVVWPGVEADRWGWSNFRGELHSLCIQINYVYTYIYLDLLLYIFRLTNIKILMTYYHIRLRRDSLSPQTVASGTSPTHSDSFGYMYLNIARKKGQSPTSR